MEEKIKDLVKDPDWQRIRKSMIGKWNEYPSWCCKQLRDYLGNITTCPINKLRIVMNYLTGTGFRTGRISHPCVNQIRSSISSEMKRRTVL